MLLLTVSLLLAPPAPTATPDLRARMIEAVPECGKMTNTDRMLACDGASRLLLVEPRKATVLFVAMWSRSQFNQPVVASPDYLHVAPAGASQPTNAQKGAVAAGAMAATGAAVAFDDPKLGAAALAAGVVVGVGAGFAVADEAHQRKWDRRIALKMIRAVYANGGDDYCHDMLRALDQVDWTSRDSIDRFVAAHEQALALAPAPAPSPAHGS